MRLPRLLVLFALGTALGCGSDQPKLPSVSQTLPNLPLPPRAQLLSRAGSADALQITFVSSLTPEEMATFYRRVLSSGIWRLVSDTKSADGAVALYAEREGPPIWVRIRKTAGAPGCTVEIAGAVTKDSAQADSAKAGKPSV